MGIITSTTGADARRILIVDDHPVVREGLRMVIGLDPRLTVCGEAGSLAEGVRQFRELQPDLVLVDITLQNGSGLELTKSLVSSDRGAMVLVTSVHDEKLYAERVLRALEVEPEPLLHSRQPRTLRQIHDADFLAAADVKHLPHRRRGFRQVMNRSHHIGHITKAALLLTITIHPNGLVCQRRLYKTWQHHAILPGLARPNRVEQTEDDDRQPDLAVIGQRQKFVNRF